MIPQDRYEYIDMKLLLKNETFLNLSWDDVIVPDNISKYFNGSTNRNDYQMSGDAEFKIIALPKKEYPTIESFYNKIVKEEASNGFFTSIEGCFHNGYQQKTIKPISFIYNAWLSCFNGFDELKNVNWNDFLPESNITDTVILRGEPECSGNGSTAVYETDNHFLLTVSETS